MTKILEGVRILEVAEHTFVPAASAALADLGAEVIKIEHVSRGDAMRGLASTGRGHHGGRCPRAPRALEPGQAEPRPRSRQPDGLEVLYKLAATCDVFLTNKLPRVATKLRIDVDDIRAPTRTSSTCAAPGKATAGPTPTRARTTRWPTGPGPESPTARSGRRTTTSPIHRRRRSATRSARSRSPERSWGRCSIARRPATRPSSTCRCSPRACGRWAARWRCRCR